ncbi:MAG: hypothetical protein AB1638_09890 [Nitrospirota bacterium]
MRRPTEATDTCLKVIGRLPADWLEEWKRGGTLFYSKYALRPLVEGYD